MGFALRLVLGFLLVLAACSSSESATTWRRMKLLSQEQSTLESTDPASETPNKESAVKEQEKLKTDETNKIVSEVNLKEQESSSAEHKSERSQTVNNDLSKDSTESDKTTHPEPEDLNINIEKYISENFHDKNNVYKLQTSPDVEKYIDSEASQSFLETTPQNSDAKYESIKNDISKKLEYIDEKFAKTVLFEATTNKEASPVHRDIIKFKNATFLEGSKVRNEEELESGKSLDSGFSYTHSVSDEQKDTTLSETFFDNSPKTNETSEEVRKQKTTTDPEEVHEKLNQTERRTALLSNKIELDNADENRKTKWSFHYSPTTPGYATTTGQKEEVVFVPYTKNSPMSISKRGSTKFVDTVSTQNPANEETKSLDEAAVENQIYPVQVPAPNSVPKQNGLVTTETSNLTESTTTNSENSTKSDSLVTSPRFAETSTPLVATTSSLPTTQSNSGPVLAQTTLQTSTPTVIIPERSTLIPQNPTLTPASPTVTSPKTSTFISINLDDNETSTSGKAAEEKSTINNVLSSEKEYSTIGTNEEGATKTIADTTLETTTEVSTTNDFVSDQTVPTVIANETRKNVTVEAATPNQTESPGTETTTVDETTTFVPETTLSPLATLSTAQTEQMVPKITTTIKLEDRTSSSRSLRNLTSPVIDPTTTEMVATTLDNNANIIYHSERSSTTPNNIVNKQGTPVERRVTPDVSTSDPSSESTTGSTYPEEQQEEGINSGKIAAIVISCIGASCFIILAILWFVMRKRHKRFNYGQRCTPVSLDDYSVDNVSTYNSVRRKGMRASKRSYGNPAFEEASLTHLLNFPELMKFGTNKEAISSEYDDIPQISVQASELPGGCDVKNRYANVIPLPESRVFLSAVDECPNSDYINANFVTGPKSFKNYYIACQAPMQETVDDFWRMIWEQHSRVVLMLTHLFENGSEKCFDYLPPSEVLDCHRIFGDFQITLNRREVKEKYIISSLQLKNMVENTWREVTHLWYLGWPERGVPLEVNLIVAFLIEARSYIKAMPPVNDKQKESSALSEHSPVVVHCSPGTGRTGTVIACDIAIREFELSRQVDIPKTVYQIRRNRAGAVQTKEQYEFIYRVVSWYANKLTGGVLDSP